MNQLSPSLSTLSPLQFSARREKISRETVLISPAYTPDTRVIEVKPEDGPAFKLRQYGNPKRSRGPVVLYLTGLAPISTGEDPFHEAGIDDFRVYSLDRGYVQNGDIKLNADQEIQTARAALDWLADKFKQKVSVAGFSLGGLTALKLAAQQPDKLQQVALFSPTLFGGEALRAALKQLPFDEATKRQLASLGKGFRGAFRKVNVPVHILLGSKENKDARPGDPMRMLSLRHVTSLMNELPKGQPGKLDVIFDGEGHTVSEKRLRAVRDTWCG